MLQSFQFNISWYVQIVQFAVDLLDTPLSNRDFFEREFAIGSYLLSVSNRSTIDPRRIQHLDNVFPLCYFDAQSVQVFTVSRKTILSTDGFDVFFNFW